jgi:hypothetical protein
MTADATLSSWKEHLTLTLPLREPGGMCWPRLSRIGPIGNFVILVLRTMLNLYLSDTHAATTVPIFPTGVRLTTTVLGVVTQPLTVGAQCYFELTSERNVRTSIVAHCLAASPTPRRL